MAAIRAFNPLKWQLGGPNVCELKFNGARVSPELQTRKQQERRIIESYINSAFLQTEEDMHQ